MVRPFKGIKLSEGPRGPYDVVIIGAGISGLITANLLIKEGLKVLLVERHYMVGGYCSTFKRKGYTFDAATHFYPLLGNPRSLTGALLARLGITCGWVKMDPVDHFHFPDGSTFKVPADFNEYLAAVKGEFPHEAEALDKFFDLVRQANLHGLLYYFRGKQSKWIEPHRALTVRDVLDKFFKTPKLKLLLTADGPHWGAPPNNTSFIFDSMLRLSYFMGNYYPVGGSQNFADELAARFEEQGGHILMKSGVKRILVERGRAVGVEVETGPVKQRFLRRVQSEMVISNADMIQTVHEMMDHENLDREFVDSLDKLQPSYPCFLTHIAVRDVKAETLAAVQGYYWNDWNPDLLGRNGLRFKIFVPTLYEPRMAPKGGHVIIVQKVLEMEYDDVEDWAGHKGGVEDYIMENLEKVIPGIGEKIIFRSSASALTSFRFTGNFKGAMLGWAMSPEQLGVDRPDVESPVENLYFTGHWTRPGGGITPVIISAMRVAKLIRKESLRLTTV